MAVTPGSWMEKAFQEIICIKKPYYSFNTETWHPPTDVYETENELVVKMAISGVRPEDISVILTGDILTISGRRQDPSNHKKLCFYLMEIRYGYFERSIVLPKNIDESRIEASYKDGFLQITIPKAEETKKEQQAVEIKITV
ncbi:MAG TPA: Hsp20/alpha crystallin family protein [Candidatus Hypogeohydataceae bacterium YC41]